MLFHSIEFFIFFAVVLVLKHVTKNKFDNIILLAASYFFYSWWSLKFVYLLLISTVIDFYAGKFISQSQSKYKKTIFLMVSLIVNLGILFTFKYWVWMNELFGNNLGYSFVLPLGISFYTFQSMSYSLDVYMNKTRVIDSFLTFALYVSFFPQLVAGPIERSTGLLKQLNDGAKFGNNYIVSGLSLFTWGMIKKVVFADNFAVYVDEVYSIYDFRSSLDLLLATYAFAFQIYCDFSGYTDMARGVARLLGYELMKNFDLPYFAHNIKEFWQKWHISLSTWFRDYLYIPIGGNRCSKLRQYFNIFITMLIAGVWHGANLTFIAWGAVHGFFIMIYHFAHNFFDKSFWLNSRSFIMKFIKIFFTFNLVCLGWIFFRSESIEQAFSIIAKISVFDLTIIKWEYSFTLMLILFALMLVKRYGKAVTWIASNQFMNWILIWMGGLSIIIFGALKKTDFIYFQF